MNDREQAIVKQIQNGEYLIWRDKDELNEIVCLIVIEPEQLQNLINKKVSEALKSGRMPE